MGMAELSGNAYSFNVPTTAGSGTLYDSQESAHRNSRSVLNQRGIVRLDQSSKSESSDDEEESGDPSSVGGTLPPASWHAIRSVLDLGSSKSSTARRDSREAEKFGHEHRSRLLSSIDEGSDDDTYHPLHRTDDQSRSLQARSRRHVSYGFSSRNRPSKLGQQLGSLPNASLQSLISSLTTSSGSSGSSTATQKSYDKLAVRRRRRPSKRRTLKEGGKDSRSTAKLTTRSRRASEKLDLMAPIEALRGEDEVRANMSRPASAASRASRKDSILSPPTPASRGPSVSSSRRSSSRNDAMSAWKRQETFNSDSGISVTSSPDQKSPGRSTQRDGKSQQDDSSESSGEDSGSDDELPSALVPTLRASSAAGIPNPSPMRALPDVDPLVQRLQEQEAAMKHHMLHSPQPKRRFKPQVNPSHSPSPALPLYDPRATSAVPDDYPYPPPAPVPHGDPAYFQAYYDAHDHHLQARRPQFEPDMSKTSVIGYEMIAQKLSLRDSRDSQAIRPLYRKFEHLNHRVLLHLQDEISELEEELRLLDETIAQMDAFYLPEDQTQQPSSRRGDRHGSDLHHQRTQILGKIFLKLQQYNQALSSYSANSTRLPHATEPEVASYRQWMSENMPVHEIETQFLNDDHRDDLISPSIPSKPATLAPPSRAADQVDLKQLVFLLYFTMILLLLAFSMLPGFLSKILILFVVVACTGSIVLKDFSRSSISASKKDA